MTMRIAYMSDLHLEFYEPGHLEQGGGPVAPSHIRRIVAESDLVVLAGDIHKGGEGVSWASSAFGDHPVVYVLGNHEPYNRNLADIYRECRMRSLGTNVHVLENEVLEVGGLRILGATLWTDYALYGAPEAAKEYADAHLNDHRRIHTHEGRFRPAYAEKLHRETRRWMADMLENGPAVVVTHHAPHPGSEPAEHADSPLSPAFCSDLSGDLLDGNRVPLWIHGHTHHCVDYRVCGTRVVSNQPGYPHESVAGFDPEVVVEVRPT